MKSRFTVASRLTRNPAHLTLSNETHPALPKGGSGRAGGARSNAVRGSARLAWAAWRHLPARSLKCLTILKWTLTPGRPRSNASGATGCEFLSQGRDDLQGSCNNRCSAEDRGSARRPRWRRCGGVVTGPGTAVSCAGSGPPLRARQRRAFRGRHVGFVFQDPLSSLNPLMTVGRRIGIEIA